MFIPTFIMALMLNASLLTVPPFEKFVHSENGDYLGHLTNTWERRDGEVVLISIATEPEIVVRHPAQIALASRQSGPVNWGLVEDSYFAGGYGILLDDYNGIRIIGGPRQFIDIIELAQAPQQERRAIWDRKVAFWRAHHFEVHSLNEHIVERAGVMALIRGEDTLRRNWDLSFDAIYRSLLEVTVVAAHEGNLMVWERDRTEDPENNEWITRDLVATEVDSHFRILRAGERLYLVDVAGAIYAGIDETHRKIGTVRNWEGDSPVILLEDQHDERIGFLRVSETNEITMLSIDWTDASFAGDFLTEIDSADLRAAILRMAEILDEEEGLGGEDE